MIWILNLVKETFDLIFDYFFKKDGIKNIYLVGNNGKKLLTVDELQKPYDHAEIEFIFNKKTYIHVLPMFHRIYEPPLILSAVLNNKIDITNHVNKYLINDLKYLQVKHIIPPKYLNTFDILEILDNDCNSLIYRKKESRLDFLEPINITKIQRHKSCHTQIL